MDEADHPWCAVRTFRTLAQANDHALVAVALGYQCRVIHSTQGGMYVLETEQVPDARLLGEWNDFEQEILDNNPDSGDVSSNLTTRHWSSLIAWMVAVMIAFIWQHRHPALAQQFVCSSIDLVENHQWWRALTALFLHADFGHLMGNVLCAILFAPFVSRHYGAWFSWIWILLSGSLGNGINALCHYPESFFSLGSSTAIFSALGLLTASGISDLWRLQPRPRWPRLSMPLFAGIALLGLWGNSPDPLTDVAGHVCGFLVGLCMGLFVNIALQHQSPDATGSEPF